MKQPSGKIRMRETRQWQQGELHASRREWEDARACFGSLLTLYPGDAEVLLQLSYVESLAGRYRNARGYALAAFDAKPQDPSTIQELVARLRTFNEGEALLACVSRLGRLDQVPIPLLLACAAQLSNLNEQTRALALLDEAKRGDPNYPATLMARAQVLIYFGKFEQAEADLQRCLSRAPEIAQLYWLLSRVRKQTPDSNHVDAIRRQLAQPRRPADTALLGFALHKELDDLGDYPGAWNALQQACAAKRSTLQYSLQESRALVEALLRTPTPGAALDGREHAGGADHVPIFIVGMHRSGTTLLEQLLDASPSVRGVGELYDFTSAMRDATDHHCKGVIDGVIVDRAALVDFAPIGRKYLQGMGWRLGQEANFTDKLPSNFLNIGFICRALPQAKILHMVRDPVETSFSNLRELFSSANPYSYDQLELADYFVQYRRLMAHWHDAFPGRILDVDYARLTEDTEATMREAALFCGLEYVEGMRSTASSSRAVSTASAVQVRGDVVRRETPKWAPYRQYLQPLIDTLWKGGVAVPD